MVTQMEKAERFRALHERDGAFRDWVETIKSLPTQRGLR